MMIYLINFRELRYFPKTNLSFLVSLVENKSMPKTTFRATNDHYEFLVMTFGSTNLHAAFMDLMNKVSKEYPDRFIEVFIDAIFEYSKNLEEYERHLRVVLQLHKKKLLAKFSKCDFWLSYIVGHVIWKDGIFVNRRKLKQLFSGIALLMLQKVELFN